VAFLMITKSHDAPPRLQGCYTTPDRKYWIAGLREFVIINKTEEPVWKAPQGGFATIGIETAQTARQPSCS
jgi:hypothetical protein